MTKTKKIQVAIAFSLAIFLGITLSVAPKNVVSKSSTNAKTAITDLLIKPTFTTNACCGN